MSRLDFDIKCKADISNTANRLSRSLDSHQKALKKYNQFVSQAVDYYRELDEQGYENTLNIGYSPGSASEGIVSPGVAAAAAGATGARAISEDTRLVGPAVVDHAAAANVKDDSEKKGIKVISEKSSLFIGDGSIKVKAVFDPSGIEVNQVKWSSNHPSIAEINDQGEVKPKAPGTVTITAQASFDSNQQGSKTFKITDVVDRTVTVDDFTTLPEWSKKVEAKERSLIGIGQSYLTYQPDGTTGSFYEGNVIVKKVVLEYKTVPFEMPLSGPGNPTKTVSVRVPKTIKYTLHRHNYQDTSETFWALVAGAVERKVVYTQHCSCGQSYTSTWEIPKVTDMKGDPVTVTPSQTKTPGPH